jgi:hypothetical protein
MATIPSTVAEFNADVVKFMDISSNKNNTQEKVKASHKCVTLRYLGLVNITEEQLNTCAMHLTIVTEGATARGWLL